MHLGHTCCRPVRVHRQRAAGRQARVGRQHGQLWQLQRAVLQVGEIEVVISGCFECPGCWFHGMQCWFQREVGQGSLLSHFLSHCFSTIAIPHSLAHSTTRFVTGHTWRMTLVRCLRPLALRLTPSECLGCDRLVTTSVCILRTAVESLG